MSYTTADIRQFLTDALSDEELTTLCFDYFRDVYNDFASGMGKGEKIQRLIEYCQRREIIPNLFAAIQRARPEQYEERFPQTPEEVRHKYPRLERDPRRVFISHAHEDADFAHRLAADLQERDWHVWIAPDSIRPGEKWVEAINRGLDESGVFVLVLTPAAIRSEWVKDETNVAIELRQHGHLRFIPLDVESCNVPLLWTVFQYVSFRGRYEDGLTALLAELEQRPDDERQRRLARLYARATQAEANQDWAHAISLFKQILAINRNYKDTAQRLAEAQKQEQLAELYDQGVACVQRKEWEQAIALFQQILDVDKDYKDALLRLIQARVGRLEQLYTQAQQAASNQDWAKAVGLFQHILDVEKDYKDAAQRLTQAKTQQQLEQLYARAKQAEANRDWQLVIAVCREIVSIAPHYRDTQWLLAKANLRFALQRIRAAWARHKTTISVVVALALALIIIGVLFRPDSKNRPATEPPTPQVSVETFLITKDGEPSFTIRPGARITATVQTIVAVRVQVSTNQQDLLFTWYACSAGSRPVLQKIGNSQMIYIPPSEPSADCLVVVIEKRGVQLDRSEIFVDLQK